MARDVKLSTRKKLQEIIRPYDVKHYLVLKKGILSLNNCEIDAHKFTELCDMGLKHYRLEEFWQAGNYFYPALFLWQGCFSTEIFHDESSDIYCDRLQVNLAEMASKWGKNLIDIGYDQEALLVLQKAWEINRAHDGLVKQLYAFHLKKQNISQAKKVLNQYSAILKQENFTESEINEIVAFIKNDLKCAYI